MNTQNPNQQGGGSTPAQLANMLTKTIREEMAAQRRVVEKTLETLLANSEEKLKEVGAAESDRLLTQFDRAQKKLNLADQRETGLALRESELASREAALDYRDREIEGKLKLNASRIADLEARERANAREMETLEKTRIEAEKFVAIQVLQEKLILDRHQRSMAIKQEMDAAIANGKAEEEMLQAQGYAEDQAIQLAMSSIAPGLEEKLNAITQQILNGDTPSEQMLTPKAKQRKAAPKSEPKKLSEVAPKPSAPEALPDA